MSALAESSSASAASKKKSRHRSRKQSVSAAAAPNVQEQPAQEEAEASTSSPPPTPKPKAKSKGPVEQVGIISISTSTSSHIDTRRLWAGTHRPPPLLHPRPLRPHHPRARRNGPRDNDARAGQVHSRAPRRQGRPRRRAYGVRQDARVPHPRRRAAAPPQVSSP